MALVSIVVPVYNTQKYLKKCLDSLVEQTVQDIEIIAVNDGSTDESGMILETYQNQFPKKVKVISQENAGISAARNKGIEAATGKYITFIDSDDSIDLQFCEKMLKKIEEEQLDVAVCDFYEVDEDSCEKKYNKIIDFNSTTVYEESRLLFHVNTSPWNKLYRKEFLDDHKILFPLGVKYEDAVFFQKILAKGGRIGKLNEALIFYLIRSGSETTVVKENVVDIFKILDQINKLYRNEGKEKYMKIKEYLEFFNVNRITVYNLQQVYQRKEDLVDPFIEHGFQYLDRHFRKWRKNQYFIQDNSLPERIIKSNKVFTKTYVKLMRRLKK